MNTVKANLINYLVIGYGNTLRSDDGAGYRIAETIADWQLEQIKSLPVHQLTPELAAEIAQANTVIFVDAIATDPSASPEVTLEELFPDATEQITAHYADPRSLLALTQILYHATPTAYRILIPATNFGFGETLSLKTETNCHTALAKIKAFLCVTAELDGEYY